MNFANFKAGLDILAPYFTKPDGYHLGADHDVIYVYSTDTPLSDDDFQKMKTLGWHQTDVDEDGPYEPEAGWSTFV